MGAIPLWVKQQDKIKTKFVSVAPDDALKAHEVWVNLE